jgi:hypothetical protein
MAKLTKLKLSVKTGSEAFSGTDAPIYLGLCRRGKGVFYLVPTRPEHLEAGDHDTFELGLADGPELGELTGVVLVNGMRESRLSLDVNPAWRVLWARLEAVDAAGHSWLLADAMLERWLGVDEGQAPGVFLPLKQPFEDLGAKDVVGKTSCALTPIP